LLDFTAELTAEFTAEPTAESTAERTAESTAESTAELSLSKAGISRAESAPETGQGQWMILGSPSLASL